MASTLPKADRAFDPGPIPDNECGLIDWGDDEPDLDAVAAAELLVRLRHDSDRVMADVAISL